MRELDDVHDIIVYNIQMGSCVCEDNAAGRLSTGLYTAAAVRALCARICIGRPCPSLRRRTTTTQQHYTSVRRRCRQRRERRQMVNCSGGQNRRRPTWLSIVHRARFWCPLNGHSASLSHVSFTSPSPTLCHGPTPSRSRTHTHTHAHTPPGRQGSAIAC